jgi:glucuronokinase
MRYWAELTDKARQCLLDGHLEKLGDLLNAGFDKRRQIYQISAENIRMVDTARSIGASATFTGSGGAIVGAYTDERMFAELRKTLRKLNIAVIKPQIVPGTGSVKA